MYSFLKFITYSFLSAFCFLSLSDVSIQSGGINTWSQSSTEVSNEPPANKRIYVDKKIHTSISGSCVITTRGLWTPNMLRRTSSHVVLAFPVILGDKDNKADQEKKHLVLEFPAEIMARTQAQGAQTIESMRASAGYRLVNVYEVNTWGLNYRSSGTRLPTSDCSSSSEREYRLSGDERGIHFCFSPTKHVEINQKGTVFLNQRQRANTPTPLTSFPFRSFSLIRTTTMQRAAGRQVSLNYSYVPDEGRAGALTVNLRTPSESGGCLRGTRGN